VRSWLASALRVLACIVLSIVVLFIAFVVAAMWPPSPEVSDSMAKLKSMVVVDLPGDAITWETFGTPEYTGAVPGPTDYVTLVAELKPVKAQWFALQRKSTRIVAVTPEAVRPWMSKPFRTMLKQYAGNTVSTDALPQCRPYDTVTVSTKRPLHGMICFDHDRLLLYMVVHDRTQAHGSN
jgi:hypothetical protein